jgi:membrane-associated phospholipid phosphatase
MKPLIPVRLRLPALSVALLALIITMVLGAVVSGGRRAGRIDAAIIREIHALVGQRSLAAHLLVSPTDAPVLFAVIAALLVVGLVRRRWEVAILAVAGPSVAVGLTELLLKPLFARRLHGWLSYPSGHTVAAVSTYTVALLVITMGASRLRRSIALLAWAALVVVLTVGLVAMNYHYPTDTIGGFFLALGVVLPCAVLADHWRFHGRTAIPGPRVGGSVRLPEQEPHTAGTVPEQQSRTEGGNPVTDPDTTPIPLPTAESDLPQRTG